MIPILIRSLYCISADIIGHSSFINVKHCVNIFKEIRRTKSRWHDAHQLTDFSVQMHIMFYFQTVRSFGVVANEIEISFLQFFLNIV